MEPRYGVLEGEVRPEWVLDRPRRREKGRDRVYLAIIE
jgi:hypothetical protein